MFNEDKNFLERLNNKKKEKYNLVHNFIWTCWMLWLHMDNWIIKNWLKEYSKIQRKEIVYNSWKDYINKDKKFLKKEIKAIRNPFIDEFEEYFFSEISDENMIFSIRQLFLLENFWLKNFEKFVEIIQQEPFNCDKKYLDYDKNIFSNWKSFQENALDICIEFKQRIEENEKLSFVH